MADEKKVFILLILLSLVGFYAMTATAKDGSGVPDSTATARSDAPSPTAKPETCKVHTGVDGGTVNLRECEGALCGDILDILTEGESLDIVKAGLYVNVTTMDDMTGWLNSKYCKKEK